MIGNLSGTPSDIRPATNVSYISFYSSVILLSSSSTCWWFASTCSIL